MSKKNKTNVIDNLNSNKKFKIFSNIINAFQFIFPFTVDTISIISLFTPKLNAWITQTIGVIPSIIIIFIVNLFFISGIVLFFHKKESHKFDRVSQLISRYKDITIRYSDYLTFFNEKHEELDSVDKLYTFVSFCLKDMIDSIKEILCEFTGKKIRVCIKAFPELYTHCDASKMELITFCRSDKTLSQSILERSDRVCVNDNTDFKKIMIEKNPYFAFNNLKNFKSVTKTKYENSTHNWSRKYNATIVYPIHKYHATINGTDYYQILGFICIDTLSTKAFTSEIGPICISFLESISFLLCSFLEKCINCRENIEKNQENFEGESINV